MRQRKHTELHKNNGSGLQSKYLKNGNDQTGDIAQKIAQIDEQGLSTEAKSP